MKGILADQKWFFCDILRKSWLVTFIFQSVGSKQQGRSQCFETDVYDVL